MAGGKDKRPKQGPRTESEEIRCLCSSLLARRRGDCIELRCRRCKRDLCARGRFSASEQTTGDRVEKGGA
jgi:phage FluMu protein Com